MANIKVLDQSTINQIAAGEVIERPASVVKELLENAIDAKSTAITIEIKDGGTTFIRITDNGSGIEKNEIPLAFLRHSTSKIKSVEDLITVSSLGFRGEALSSIAAVSQVELITKTPSALNGVRYLIEGGLEKKIEEIGAPEGTTFLIRNLFYNTPARRKFLKSPATEAGYISDIIEKIALSHPEISVRFISNNQNKLHTSGNSNLKDNIYHIYGREVATNLIEIDAHFEDFHISGYIGKPVVSRGNRSYENYFINGRYIKNNLISKAIEDGYQSFLMQHKYPFTALKFTIEPSLLDVNVHPTKMELRFQNGETFYQFIYNTIKEALTHRELIHEISLSKEKKIVEELPKTRPPEPFEVIRKAIEEKVTVENKAEVPVYIDKQVELVKEETGYQSEQMVLFDDQLLSKASKDKHKIIGQLFETYWLVEFKNSLYIIDQHAAHEKVLYEKLLKSLGEREFTSQSLNPPIILTLSMKEEELLKKYLQYFKDLGFEMEPFGGKEYAIRAIPDNLFGLAQKDVFIELFDGLANEVLSEKPEKILDKIATMACKAAVKGNNRLSVLEAKELINHLLELDDPYTCPHGRPTIVSMTQYELEKKFKRIV